MTSTLCALGNPCDQLSMRLPGPAALPGFERQRLFDLIEASGAPLPTRLDARYVHHVDVASGLDDAERAVLDSLLAYGTMPSDSGPTALTAATLEVIPRPGTLSPWSSKATDIARACGLTGVRRIERSVAWFVDGAPAATLTVLRTLIHDRMTETVLAAPAAAHLLFDEAQPRPLGFADGPTRAEAIARLNATLGLGLDQGELDYLENAYRELDRRPTDVELMMFAQVNSEHCRHKIFNASWIVDGEARDVSLFDLIRRTHKAHPGGVLSAYSDNCAVTRGSPATGFSAPPMGGTWREHATEAHIAVKVETHNHPTAISPFPGAATGSGGEIRDEAATGRGGRAKAGLTGFTVSDLLLPGARTEWESAHGRPNRIASALDIMLEAPLGAAGYNNEFGRPAVCGYFRTYEQSANGTSWGYHKPIMIAGGVGTVWPEHVAKGTVRAGHRVVVLGGPAMLIGLGGSAASSSATGAGHEGLDYASVQRGNAEMQRRCQQVIDACRSLGQANPITSIHDVGAGGLSNAVPEIVDADGLGASLDLRAIPSADAALSPLELWCNESQERYVLAVAESSIVRLREIAARERCPLAVLGTAEADGLLQLSDARNNQMPVALPMATLLGKLPRMHRKVESVPAHGDEFDARGLDVTGMLRAVLATPTVGDKSFLVTIGDRTVGGLVSRDQMIGPHQVPVADCAVTLSDFRGFTGEAMAMGERSPIAVIDAPASGRMAVAEAITNMVAAPVSDLGAVVLSANWMAACGHAGQDAALHATVSAVSELCQSLGICIPVGKDSLSMKTVWDDERGHREVVSPLSLVVSAFAPVHDVRGTLTPQLDTHGDALLFVDLARGAQRLGGSMLARVNGAIGSRAPDVDAPATLAGFFGTLRALADTGHLAAYHDRSDGGLAATLAEMAICSGTGLEVDISALGDEPLAALFCEELGAVVQPAADLGGSVRAGLEAAPGLSGHVHRIARVRDDEQFIIRHGDTVLVDESLTELHSIWSTVTHRMARLRDNPECADEAHATRGPGNEAALFARVNFDLASLDSAPAWIGRRPRAAILREQGVNGHAEMAAAFHASGFEAVDVHMSDIHAGRIVLEDFQVLAACGGFSYGDVLGGGGGWAGAIRHDARARDQFAHFFERDDTLTLGVCNGCQMLSRLADLIPGAAGWPQFVTNRSNRFEARVSNLEVLATPSVFLGGLAGCVIPVPVSHGEGRADCDGDHVAALGERGRVAGRYVDRDGQVAVRYPANPNGSPAGLAALTSADGRVTIMMPHPERAVRTVQLSWHPAEWGHRSPWFRMFTDARAWFGTDGR